MQCKSKTQPFLKRSEHLVRRPVFSGSNVPEANLKVMVTVVALNHDCKFSDALSSNEGPDSVPHGSWKEADVMLCDFQN